MPEIKPAVPIAVLLAALGFTFLITRDRETHGARAERRVVMLPAPAADSSPSRTAGPRHPVSQAEFDQLVEEWRPLNTGPGKRYVYGEEEYLLADRCVERFGCGDELIRLMKAVALQDDGIDRVFHSAVRKFLAEKAGPSERALVATITSDAKIREQWCYYAGAGCTPQDATELTKLLTEEKDQGAVLTGSALTLALIDPVAATKFAVEQDDAGNWSPVRGEVFKDIVASVKDPAWYPSLEPEVYLAGNAAWELLVKRWAVEDGPGLIRHVNAHPDNFAPDDVRAAILKMMPLENGRRRAFDAVQDLKNADHFEQAVTGIIPYLTGTYEKEMIELAGQIQSPERRAKALKQIKDYPETIKQLP